MNILPQLAVNGLTSAAIYALVGVSFLIPFRTTRFFNFAHAAVFTIAAYMVFMFKVWAGFPLVVSIFLGLLISTLLGIALGKIVYQPLNRKRASTLILLLAFLGVYIILQNIISLFFGDDAKSIRSGTVVEGVSFCGAKITSIQILTVCTSIFLFIILAILLKKTIWGKAIRAVANDIELAQISGIHSGRVVLLSFAIGSLLAGVAGILMALDVDMSPTMGMNALIMGIIAVIIGGINSVYGVAFGALLLGLAQHFGIWKIGSQWQDAIAFVILVLFLLFKPEGFFGKKVKSATV